MPCEAAPVQHLKLARPAAPDHAGTAQFTHRAAGGFGTEAEVIRDVLRRIGRSSASGGTVANEW